MNCLHKPLRSVLAAGACALWLSGCTVIAVGAAAVGVTATVVGVAADAAVGTAKVVGKGVGKAYDAMTEEETPTSPATQQPALNHGSDEPSPPPKP